MQNSSETNSHRVNTMWKTISGEISGGCFPHFPGEGNFSSSGNYRRVFTGLQHILIEGSGTRFSEGTMHTPGAWRKRDEGETYDPQAGGEGGDGGRWEDEGAARVGSVVVFQIDLERRCENWRQRATGNVSVLRSYGG